MSFNRSHGPLCFCNMFYEHIAKLCDMLLGCALPPVVNILVMLLHIVLMADKPIIIHNQEMHVLTRSGAIMNRYMYLRLLASCDYIVPRKRLVYLFAFFCKCFFLYIFR